MSLPDKKDTNHPRASHRWTTRRMTLLALLLAAALVLGLVERMIPMDAVIPGVRLGLPNAMVMLVLYLFTFRDALLIVVLKCVILALVAGTIVSFTMSFSGSLLSLFLMALLRRLLNEDVSPVGVSIVGAIFHNIGQLLAAAFILGSLYVLPYLPILLASGVGTGLLIGLAAKATLPYARVFMGK
jgi:heptaprenyl diphosphate synthase